MKIDDAPPERRDEITRALETTGHALTARQIYSCCPSFTAESELRRELHAMAKDGALRVKSEVSPARYALPGTDAPPVENEVHRVDDAAVQRRRAGVLPELERAIAMVVPPAPTQHSEEGVNAMPKPKADKPTKRQLIIEVLKTSRDPLLVSEVAAAAKLPKRNVEGALRVLRTQGEAHVAAYLDGNKKKSQWAIGPGTGKPRKGTRRAAPRADARAPSSLSIWLSNGGSMRLEKGEKSLDLELADALELKEFMLKLDAVALRAA